MIRIYVVEVAVEIGDRPALLVGQLHYWHEKAKEEEQSIGKWIDGVHYVYNTYQAWNEQFPHWSLNSVKNVFKKLVDSEIVFRSKYFKGWNQTRAWGLNYSHPIAQKLVDGWYKNWSMHKAKTGRCYNTYNTQKEQTKNTTPVVELRVETSKDPYQTRTRTDGELKEQKVSLASGEFKQAHDWLVSLDEIDRDRVDKYIKAQVDRPKVRNPIGYERYVTSQVWRKHQGMENHCDFEVTMGLKRVSTPHIHTRVVSYEEKMGADISADEEMQLLYEQGGLE